YGRGRSTKQKLKIKQLRIGQIPRVLTSFHYISSPASLLLDFDHCTFYSKLSRIFMAVHIKTSSLSRWVPVIVIVLLIGISIPVTLFSTQQPQQTQQNAESKIQITPPGVCNVTVSVDDGNACPR